MSSLNDFSILYYRESDSAQQACLYVSSTQGEQGGHILCGSQLLNPAPPTLVRTGHGSQLSADRTILATQGGGGFTNHLHKKCEFRWRVPCDRGRVVTPVPPSPSSCTCLTPSAHTEQPSASPGCYGWWVHEPQSWPDAQELGWEVVYLDRDIFNLQHTNFTSVS